MFLMRIEENSGIDDPLNFSESGWCGRIFSEMKILTTILAGLLVVGCGKTDEVKRLEEENQKLKAKLEEATPSKPQDQAQKQKEKPSLEERVIGSYDTSNQDGGRDWFVFQKDGTFENWEDGVHTTDGTWAVKNGEIHVNQPDGGGGSPDGGGGDPVEPEALNLVLMLNDDGSITVLAVTRDGKRKDLSKEKQPTFKKIK